jgi:hypothetical protein
MSHPGNSLSVRRGPHRRHRAAAGVPLTPLLGSSRRTRVLHSPSLRTPVLGRPALRTSALRTSLLGASVLAASVLGACADPEDRVTLNELREPILRGEVDEDHPEVMLLANRAGFLCTGTVIHVTEQSGFLLTAAHCATEDDGTGLVPLPARDFVVVPGADFAEGTIEYPVVSVSVEPSYDGSFAADVAVVRFVFGTDEAPSVIEPLSSSEDELAVADELLLVGFGQTELDDGNTQRRSVERQVEVLDAELVVYSQEDGKGACFGDSGGPVLVTVGGRERVAAVISGGVDSIEDGCSGGLGVSMRVSAYEDFIQGALAATG